MMSTEEILKYRAAILEQLARSDATIEGVRYYQGIIVGIDFAMGKDAVSLDEKSGGGEQQ